MQDLKPQRRLLGSRDELSRAILDLLTRAPRTVRCCCADGAAFNLSSSEVVDLLAQCLLRDARARVLVLVDDHAWIDTRAARFKLLQRRFTHAVRVRTANPDDPVGEVIQLMGDELHFIDLQPARITTGEMWLNNRLQAEPRVRDFDRRWELASHDLPVDPLGL